MPTAQKPMTTADVEILLLPGIGGSGEDHWLGMWARDAARCRIVRQADWERPDRKVWLAALSAAVQSVEGPFALVAHSVGCALAAHWAAENRPADDGASVPRLRAIMMVAPSDVDSAEHTPESVRMFAPMPTLPLPGRSVVVASTDDPYVPIERARGFAREWRSRLVEIGARGHINSNSGLADWIEGQRLLRSMIEPELQSTALNHSNLEE